MIYLQLFCSFLQIGLFSFGGGYASLPLIEDQVTNFHHWMTVPEFTDLITISQMTPGPIAVNSATFVGIRIAGIPGAVAATAGCVLPSCIIIFILAGLYLRYRNGSLLNSALTALRPAVVAMIASAGLSVLLTAFFRNEQELTLSSIQWEMVFISILCFFLLRKTKVSPVAVMLLAGVIKVLFSL
ncbi:MAG TPA: chromate transporter [Candidatus Anaerobutyricum avicola]|nr:chromate transporter [Candidatus Anaerobutyricum avicola]